MTFGVDDPCDYLQCSVLGFCGCGNPEENLEFIRAGLLHINDKCPDGPSDVAREWYKGWVARGRQVFGNEQSRYFFFYWCSKEGLTEHGGSVPGWLSNKGRDLLDELNIFVAENPPTE